MMFDEKFKQKAPAKAADYSGVGGRFWRIEGKPENADQTATIGGFLLEAPHAHPAWSYYLVSVVHLRPIKGVRPAIKRYPEAEYELMVIALDPGFPLPDVDDWKGMHPLTPIDQVVQFHGCNDAEAAMVLERAVQFCADGHLSPDSDYRRAWDLTVPGFVEHIKGQHDQGPQTQ